MTFQTFLDENVRSINHIKNLKKMSSLGAKFVIHSVEATTDGVAAVDKTIYTVPSNRTLLVSSIVYKIPAAGTVRLYDNASDSGTGTVVACAFGRENGKVFKYKVPLVVNKGITLDLSASGALSSGYQFTIQGVLV